MWGPYVWCIMKYLLLWPYGQNYWPSSNHFLAQEDWRRHRRLSRARRLASTPSFTHNQRAMTKRIKVQRRTRRRQRLRTRCRMRTRTTSRMATRKRKGTLQPPARTFVGRTTSAEEAWRPSAPPGSAPVSATTFLARILYWWSSLGIFPSEELRSEIPITR